MESNIPSIQDFLLCNVTKHWKFISSGGTLTLIFKCPIDPEFHIFLLDKRIGVLQEEMPGKSALQPGDPCYYVHIAIGCNEIESKSKGAIKFIFERMRLKYREYIAAKGEFSIKMSKR